MNIEKIKDKLSQDEYNELAQFITDTMKQRDTARNESAQYRNELKKSENNSQSLKDAQADLMERLGIESLDQLTDSVKGHADAVKQYETKLKRMESQLSDRTKQIEDITKKHQRSMRDTALQKALDSHEWIDSDLVSMFLAERTVIEDDIVKYKTDTALIPLDEGVQLLAKEKPHLLKAPTSGGSGYRGQVSTNMMNTGNPWLRDQFNLTQQIELMKTDPNRAAQLKAAANVQPFNGR